MNLCRFMTDMGRAPPSLSASRPPSRNGEPNQELGPARERRETNTMPAKDGLRLNDMRRTEQAWPESGQPHHQGPVTAAQSKARRRTPQGDAELKAKEQVLGFKSPRRLEEVYNEHCERMQEREHRPRSCNDSTRRCDSQAGWNFRKAQGANLTFLGR